MLADKIRKKALRRASNPEQLDAMLVVVPPFGWLAAIVLLAGVAGLLGWSFVSTAPVRVAARGILLTDGEMISVSSPGEGVLVSSVAMIGQRVEKGDLLARIYDAAAEDKIEQAKEAVERAQRNSDKIASANADIIQSLNQQFEDQKREFNTRMADADSSIAKRQSDFAEQSSLFELKLTTMANVRAVEYALYEARDLKSSIAADFAASKSQYLAKLEAANSEIAHASDAAEEARETLASLASQYQRVSTIEAQETGIVVEALGKRGDAVAANQRLFQLMPSAATSKTDLPLTAVLYVSAEDAPKIQPNMMAEILPSSIELERDGYMYGTVISVAETPSTRGSMMQRLENDLLVDALLKDGPVTEVLATLQHDETTVSGYSWSTRRGPAFRINPGTSTGARFVVDRKRIASFVFPRLDEILPAIEPPRVQTSVQQAEASELQDGKG